MEKIDKRIYNLKVNEDELAGDETSKYQKHLRISPLKSRLIKLKGAVVGRDSHLDNKVTI